MNCKFSFNFKFVWIYGKSFNESFWKNSWNATACSPLPLAISSTVPLEGRTFLRTSCIGSWFLLVDEKKRRSSIFQICLEKEHRDKLFWMNTLQNLRFGQEKPLQAKFLVIRHKTVFDTVELTRDRNSFLS